MCFKPPPQHCFPPAPKKGPQYSGFHKPIPGGFFRGTQIQKRVAPLCPRGAMSPPPFGAHPFYPGLGFKSVLVPRPKNPGGARAQEGFFRAAPKRVAPRKAPPKIFGPPGDSLVVKFKGAPPLPGKGHKKPEVFHPRLMGPKSPNPHGQMGKPKKVHQGNPNLKSF